MAIKVGELYTTLTMDKGPFDKAIGLAKTAALGAVLAIAGVGIASGKMAIDFQKDMANINTLLGSGSEAEARTKELAQNVKDMSVETGKSLEDLSAGLYDVIGTFGDSAEAADWLKVAAVSGAAGMSTTKEAIGLLSAVTKSYGDTSLAAAKKASDLAFQTANLGVTTFPEMAASMGKVLPLAATMKVSQEELFGAMATLTGVTGNTSEVTTQLAASMNAVLKPNLAMKQALKELGYEGAKAGQDLVAKKGLVGALELLKDTSVATEKKGLAKMLGSSEALLLTLSLTGAQAADFEKKVAAMGEASGKNAAQWALFTEAIHAGLTDSNAIADGWDVPGVLREFKDNLGLTDDQVKVFQANLEALGETKALELLGAQIEGITGATEQAFRIQQDTVAATMDRVGASFNVVLLNLGEKLLPMLQTALDWVIVHMPEIQATFDAVFNAVGAVISWVVTNIVPPLIAIFEFIANTVVPALSSAFGQVETDVLPGIGSAFDVVTKNVIPALIAVFEWLRLNILPPLAQIFKAWTDNVLPLLQKAFKFVQQWISDNWPLISEVVGKVAAVVSRAAQFIADALSFIIPIVTKIAEVAFPLLGAAATWLMKIIGIAMDTIMAIWDTVASVADTVVKAIFGSWDGMANFFVGLWKGINGAIKGGINFMIGLINGMIGFINGIQFHIPGFETPFGTVAKFDWGGLNLSKIPMLAKGTPNFKGGWAIVGEEGPELAKLPGGAAVFPADQSAGMMGGAGGGPLIGEQNIYGLMPDDVERQTTRAIRRAALEWGLEGR